MKTKRQELTSEDMHLVSALALSLTGHTSPQMLRDAILQWPPAIQLLKDAVEEWPIHPESIYR